MSITTVYTEDLTDPVPDDMGEAPLAAWKKIDLLQDVLPERFQNLAEAAGGTISVEEYDEKVRRGET